MKITKQDNSNWQMLFNTQFDNLQQKSCIAQTWINGVSKLGLDNSKIPTIEYLNEVAAKYTGWEFLKSGKTYTDPMQWNREIAERKMSVSNFVRTPEELFYCSQPDIWHDVIGHIPFLLDEEYSKIYQSIARLYIEAYEKGGDKMRLQVGNINWFITEVGLIKEDGRLKAFGATLYSSSGELEKAFSKPPRPCTLDSLISLPPYDRSDIQNVYFVIDSFEQVNEVIRSYRQRYL